MKSNNKIQIFVVMLLLSSILLISSVEAIVDSSDIDLTLLTQYPDPAKAGDVVEVRINVKNVGDETANNILLEYVPDYPFSLLQGEENRKQIDILPNWPLEANYKTYLYKIFVNKDALDGSHDITFRYSINGGASWVEEDYNIDVTSKEFAEIIYIDKTKIIPGKETEISFTVNNVGNAALKNMIFSWDEDDNVILPVNTDNTRYIKYLAPGEDIKLKYTVIASVNAEPDLYELNLKLEYDIKNESGSEVQQTVSTQAGIFVGGETDFDIAFSEISAGETSFSVANIGSNQAYSVSVIIPEQPNWKVSGSNSMIIGNLNKGDYTVASFGLQPKATDTTPSTDASTSKSSGSNIIKIQIAYTDTMGTRNTVEKEVKVNLQSLADAGTTAMVPGSKRGAAALEEESFFSKYKWYIIAIILVGLYFVGNGRYKKKKLQNPELTFKEFVTMKKTKPVKKK